MKKILLLIFLLLDCNLLAIAESPLYLVIMFSDESRITYVLADEPILTFEEGNMIITSKGLNIEHSLKDIEQITYEKDPLLSLETVSENLPTYYIKDNILNVVNELSDFTVNIYHTNGKCVISKFYYKTEAATIPLQNLEKGIYILTINDNNLKFYIK